MDEQKEDGSTEVPSVHMRHTDAHNDERPSPMSFHSDVKCPSFTQKERSDVTLISYVTVVRPTGRRPCKDTFFMC